KPVEKEEPSKFDISKFLFNRFFIDVRAGVDYFYIDPGLLIPKDGKVAINSKPYLYYHASAGLDFNFIGVDLKLKNNFEIDNFSDDYLNKDDTVLRESESRTRERILTMIGYLTPFNYNNEFNFGVYFDGEFRMLQAGITVNEAIDFTDRTTTITLDPGKTHIMNVFFDTYAGGLMLARNRGRLKYKAAVGYKYSQTDSPHYMKESNTIETISSKRHAMFVHTDWEHSWLHFVTTSVYGFASFEKPDGSTVDFYGNKSFYYSSVKNFFGFTFFDHITLSAYLGYAGYAPFISQTAPWIALAVGAELFFYQYYIRQYVAPSFQAVLQLLYYFALRASNNILYAEIVAGAQVGVRIDFD
ncbi:MAG: hypothetical protein GY754_00285, partial [bacterium]|nr:hypothetical protein [bacterium]